MLACFMVMELIKMTNKIVKKGDRVKIDYTGTLDDGSIFDTSKHDEHSHPIEVEVGSGKLIKGFDDALIGMQEGEEKEIRLLPAEAYGKHKSELIKEIPKEQLPKEPEPKAGMALAVTLPNGAQIPAKIAEVDDQIVKIDLNHPLTDKTLNFKIKIVEIS